MEYKDASFQRWLPTAADGGMYDVAEVHHNADGLTLILIPDGPDRRSRTPHRLLLVWESALACQISNETYREDCWISDEGHRKQIYRELITSADRLRLMQMVASLYRYRGAQEAAGRKFHLCDDNFLRDAERLLSSEISLVMNLPPDEARDFLRKHLK